MNLLDERTTVESPTKTRIEWSSSESSFCYYQKSANEGEKGETIKVENMTFIPVHLAFRIGGFSDSESSYLYSNTVDDLKTQKMSVKYAKTKKLIASGLYSEIKETVKANDGKFQAVLYSVITHVGSKKLDNPRYVEVIFSGSASAGLSNSSESIFNLIGKTVKHTGSTQEKKGGIKYNAPTFETKIIDRATLPENVIQFAKLVTQYFKEYLKLSQGQKQETNEIEQQDKPMSDALKNYGTPPMEDGFPTLADEPIGNTDDGLPDWG
jgi:hypothetical protein